MCRSARGRYSVYKTAALPLCYTGRRPETIEKFRGFGASEGRLTTFGGASSRHKIRAWPDPAGTTVLFPGGWRLAGDRGWALPGSAGRVQGLLVRRRSHGGAGAGF